MWLSPEERRTLTAIGAVALVGLGVLLWQRQRPPLTVSAAPVPMVHSLDSASRPRSPRAERGTRREAGFRSTGQPRGASWDAALDAARRVDINTASAAELERLPEVGPALAGRIVAYRAEHGAFRSLEDLSRVAGIGPKTLEALHEYIGLD